MWGLSATVDWEINDALTLRSITAYRDSESEFNLDQDHSPNVIAQVGTIANQDQFTQEFQLLGNSFDDKLQWILGAYYFEEEGDTFELVTFSPTNFQSGGTIDNDSWAVFAQGTYDFNEKWSLTLGARYTDDTKRFTPDQFIITNNNDLVPPPLLGLVRGRYRRCHRPVHPCFPTRRPRSAPMNLRP